MTIKADSNVRSSLKSWPVKHGPVIGMFVSLLWINQTENTYFIKGSITAPTAGLKLDWMEFFCSSSVVKLLNPNQKAVITLNYHYFQAGLCDWNLQKANLCYRWICTSIQTRQPEVWGVSVSLEGLRARARVHPVSCRWTFRRLCLRSASCRQVHLCKTI